MKRNRKKTIYILAGALSCIGCLVMIAFPSVAFEAAKRGISLWASSVLPALLPFFICANFMTALGIPSYIGKFFERPFQNLFGAPGVSAFVFSVSITSGYPMGPKLIGDLRRNGVISRSDAMRMLPFCSTSGPLFMLGAVGAGMLVSPAAGAVIALSHYLGALVNGLFWRGFVRNNPEPIRGAASGIIIARASILDMFTDSMLASFKALGIICGYIVLFMMIADFIELTGALDFIREGYLKGLIKGLLEITVGSSIIAESDTISLLYQCVLCTFIISFGGLSVYAQSMSMLAGLNISSLYYLIVKFTHGLFAAIAAFFAGPFILSIETLETLSVQREEIVYRLGFIYQLLFSTKMVIMILVLFLVTILVEKLIRWLSESSGDNSGV